MTYSTDPLEVLGDEMRQAAHRASENPATITPWEDLPDSDRDGWRAAAAVALDRRSLTDITAFSQTTLRQMADRAMKQSGVVHRQAMTGLPIRQVWYALDDLASACRRAADRMEERERWMPPEAQRLIARREDERRALAEAEEGR